MIDGMASGNGTPRSGRWFERLLALGLGFVLLEGGLQVVAALAGDGDRSGRARAGDLVVVCLGDSNTYATGEAPEDSYPAHLERILDERVPDTDAVVYNLGVPGYGSAQVAGALDEALDELAPDLVLVKVGVNNLWRGGGFEPGQSEPWYRKLRTVKFQRLAWERGSESGLAGLANGRVDYEHEDRGPVEARDDPGWCAELTDDLRWCAERCRAAGARLVLVGYGFDESSYRKANDCLREAAAELELPLADRESSIAPLVEGFGRKALFQADGHPRGLGYELIARGVYDTLVAEAIVEGAPYLDLKADLHSRRHAEAPFLVEHRAPSVLHVLGQEPGASIAVLLSSDDKGVEFPSDGGVLTRGEWRPALRDDALFRACLGTDGGFAMSAEADARGYARIPLSVLASVPRVPGERPVYRAQFLARGTADTRSPIFALQPLEPPADVELPTIDVLRDLSTTDELGGGQRASVRWSTPERLEVEWRTEAVPMEEVLELREGSWSTVSRSAVIPHDL